MAIIKLSKSARPAVAPILLGAFGLGASAQLLGCGDIACPLNVIGAVNCPIGNITATEIGVTNFSTAISPEPLTWTTTISSSTDHAHSSLQVYERGFYLGTPASLNLQETNNFTGCALFFDTISSSLHFPEYHLNKVMGTCQDALGSSCVSNLMAQVSQKFSEVTKAANETSNICTDLASALHNTALHTCNTTHGGTWGNVTAREITGSSAMPPVKQSNCHPTTGANYSISLVNTYQLATNPSSNIVEPFKEGVTPILTVFYRPNSTTTDTNGQLKDPEFHLNCLRPVSHSVGIQLGLATSFRPELGMAAMVVLVASALALF